MTDDQIEVASLAGARNEIMHLRRCLDTAISELHALRAQNGGADMTPRQGGHPDCVCGHTWSAHLPQAGGSASRCTMDCLDGCTSYTAAGSDYDGPHGTWMNERRYWVRKLEEMRADRDAARAEAAAMRATLLDACREAEDAGVGFVRISNDLIAAIAAGEPA